jgi:hypothetical protein
MKPQKHREFVRENIPGIVLYHSHCSLPDAWGGVTDVPFTGVIGVDRVS